MASPNDMSYCASVLVTIKNINTNAKLPGTGIWVSGPYLYIHTDVIFIACWALYGNWIGSTQRAKMQMSMRLTSTRFRHVGKMRRASMAWHGTLAAQRVISACQADLSRDVVRVPLGVAGAPGTRRPLATPRPHAPPAVATRSPPPRRPPWAWGSTGAGLCGTCTPAWAHSVATVGQKRRRCAPQRNMAL